MKSINGKEELLNYIDNYGFALYAGVKGLNITNLWDNTSDPSWDKTLGPWLDEIIIPKLAIYPLIIKNRAGIVSKEFFQYFYKLKSEKFDLINNEAEDYYNDGYLSIESFKILEALKEGPMGVSELRKVSNTCKKENKSLFDKAMTDLKKKLAIVKVDNKSGGWGENIFALTTLAFKNETIESIKIDKNEAYYNIITKYLKNYEAISDVDFANIFDFDKNDSKEAFSILYEKGILVYEEYKNKIIYKLKG